ncbi:MAG: Rrf2 family transcriptional regulator [Christensenellaceae bacterium]|nr:Rrf2 family transcriptional regulator [Christensenellaceae bacterium]MDD6926588.1 Rrf2 family transcriptional regulator [bacterium]MDY2851866.1 Rrf2 family transcriptional regulator [Christensenellaceae bacterium]
MKLSSRSRYGLRICYILAENYPAHVSATVLEKGISVSNKYIEKIMRVLIKEKLVSAERGVSGGYYLVKQPKEVTVGQIVRALEEDMQFIMCVCEGNNCVCPTKSVWQKLYRGINDVLDSITLQNMLDENKNITKSNVCKSEE